MRLFEKICLEGFQSGLSWRTILAKRAHFRKVFEGFDFYKLARFGPTTVYAFMQATGLINDHAHECAIRARIEAARQAFERPV